MKVIVTIEGNFAKPQDASDLADLMYGIDDGQTEAKVRIYTLEDCWYDTVMSLLKCFGRGAVK